MIPANLISDAQFLRARELNLPVTILDARTFLLPSATRPSLTEHHRIEFDDPEGPRKFSCSCEAGMHGKPCWAAARALDVLVLLAANNVTISDAISHDADGEVERAVMFDGPLPPGNTFGCRRRVPFKAEPDAHPEALLAAPARSKPVEKVRGYQI
ncbi:MAG: hypothetical protein WCD76_16895 [Pyrinomonadaceae bacterium]